MKTPEEKYLNDPYYRNLVSLIENCLNNYEFTPSEVREAAVFACTRFEMRRVNPGPFRIPTEAPDGR